jgi:hypothetical protein
VHWLRDRRLLRQKNRKTSFHFLLFSFRFSSWSFFPSWRGGVDGAGPEDTMAAGAEAGGVGDLAAAVGAAVLADSAEAALAAAVPRENGEPLRETTSRMSILLCARLPMVTSRRKERTC